MSAAARVADAPPADTPALWQTDVADCPVALAAAPRLARLAVAGACGLLTALDAATGRPIDSQDLGVALLDAAWSPDGQVLALCGPDGHGTWTPGEPVRWSADRRWAARVRWSPTGDLAVAAGRRALVLPGGRPEGAWSSPQAPSTVTDLAWLDGGRRLALTAYNGVTVYRVGRQDPVAAYSYAGSHLAVAISPGDRWVVTGNQDATIHVWSRVATGGQGDELHMSGYAEKVRLLAFDESGRWLAADGADDVTVWDFSGPGPGGTQARMLAAHDRVSALAWRPGHDATLATGGTEGAACLWAPARSAAGTRQRPRTTWDPRLPDDRVEALTWIGTAHLAVARRSGAVCLHAPGRAR